VAVKLALAAIEKELTKAGAGLIDLLATVNVDKHKVYGTWAKKAGALGAAEGYYARITLPVIPEGNYELKILFVKRSGRDVALMLPVGSGATVLVLGYYSSPVLKRVGMSYFYGKSGLGTLVNGKEYTLQVKVLVQKNAALIRVGLNGKLVLEWKGDPRTLTPYSGWTLPNTRTLGLGAYRAEVIFKRAILRMTSGRAKKAPPASIRRPPSSSSSTRRSVGVRVEGS